MNKDEIKAKLVEDANFVLPEGATEEEKVAFEEVKKELTPEPVSPEVPVEGAETPVVSPEGEPVPPTVQ